MRGLHVKYYRTVPLKSSTTNFTTNSSPYHPLLAVFVVRKLLLLLEIRRWNSPSLGLKIPRPSRACGFDPHLQYQVNKGLRINHWTTSESFSFEFTTNFTTNLFLEVTFCCFCRLCSRIVTPLSIASSSVVMS